MVGIGSRQEKSGGQIAGSLSVAQSGEIACERLDGGGLALRGSTADGFDDGLLTFAGREEVLDQCRRAIVASCSPRWRESKISVLVLGHG